MRSAARNELAEKRKPSVFKRILAVLLVTVLLTGVAAYGAVYVVMNGPSIHAREQFTAMAADSVVGSAVLHLFMSSEMIDEWRQTVQDEGPEWDGSGSDKLYSVYPQPE